MPIRRECDVCGSKLSKGVRGSLCATHRYEVARELGEKLGIHGGRISQDELERLLAEKVGGTSEEDPFSSAVPAEEPIKRDSSPWGLRHASLDIETSGGFNTSYGRILCIALLLEGEREVRVLDAFRYEDEKRALLALHDLWNKFEILVTFNGKKFDSRFIAGRMMQHGLPMLPRKLHLDLLPYCRKWRLASARLASVSEALKLQDQKGHVPAEFWNRATGGDREAYDTIVAYCKQDVRCLPELLSHVRPMVTSLTLGSF